MKYDFHYQTITIKTARLMNRSPQAFAILSCDKILYPSTQTKYLISFSTITVRSAQTYRSQSTNSTNPSCYDILSPPTRMKHDFHYKTIITMRNDLTYEPQSKSPCHSPL
jgi:hypothetical protein